MEYLGLIVTVILAILGFLVTYLNNLRLARRADRLKFITTQIDEFYGPMYVITQTGRILFMALRAKGIEHGRMGAGEDAPTSQQDISEWRIWLEDVFQPLNEQLDQIIVTKAHLVMEKEMPQCLKRVLAHSAGYKAVIKKWQLGDFSESTSVIPYPAEIVDYAEKSYLYLKEQQKKLIGKQR